MKEEERNKNEEVARRRVRRKSELAEEDVNEKEEGDAKQ
jgi:hypothetical protein